MEKTIIKIKGQEKEFKAYRNIRGQYILCTSESAVKCSNDNQEFIYTNGAFVCPECGKKLIVENYEEIESKIPLLEYMGDEKGTHKPFYKINKSVEWELVKDLMSKENGVWGTFHPKEVMKRLETEKKEISNDVEFEVGDIITHNKREGKFEVKRVSATSVICHTIEGCYAEYSFKKEQCIKEEEKTSSSETFIEKDDKMETYKITKTIFNQIINVDWEDESIMYYNNNTGDWTEYIEILKQGWSFQEEKIQEQYKLFLDEIATDDQLLGYIYGMEIGDKLMTSQGHWVERTE